MSAPGYAGIGEIGRPIGEPEVRPAPKPKEEKAPSLETQLAVSKAETVQAERLLRESGEQRSQPPAAPAPAEPVNLGPPDPGKMPDPSTDPKGFEVWLEAKSARDTWKGEQHVEKVRGQAEQRGRSREIVDAYLAERPKYRPIREVVTQCYREACAELGLTQLPDNTASLDAVVDKKVRAVTKAAAAAVDDLPTGDPNNPNPNETPPGRTEGLSAGSSGARAGTKAKKDDDEPAPVSLIDVMKNRQAESDFF